MGVANIWTPRVVCRGVRSGRPTFHRCEGGCEAPVQHLAQGGCAKMALLPESEGGSGRSVQRPTLRGCQILETIQFSRRGVLRSPSNTFATPLRLFAKAEYFRWGDGISVWGFLWVTKKHKADQEESTTQGRTTPEHKGSRPQETTRDHKRPYVFYP